MLKKLAYFSCLAVVLCITAYLYYDIKLSVDRTNKYLLSKQQINQFNKEGYLIISNIFSSDEIDMIKNDIESAYELVQQQLNLTKTRPGVHTIRLPGADRDFASAQIFIKDDEKPVVNFICWIGGVKPALIDFGRDKRITTPVAQLLGSNEIIHLTNQAHYKMPGDKVKFSWHQDIEARTSQDRKWQDINKRGSFVQVFTAVDKITKENGPLIIVPGSHKEDLQLKKIGETNVDRFIKQKEQFIKQKFPDLDQISTAVLLEPGDILFMHPLLLHKSDINHSETSRKVFINGFSYPGATNKWYIGKGSAHKITVDIPEIFIPK